VKNGRAAQHICKKKLSNYLFVQAGKVNCDKEKGLCKKVGLSVGKSACLFIYSYATTEKGSLHEYSGEHDAKSLKTFCQEHLPRFTKRVDISQFSFPLNVLPNLPQVLLLSTKDTPVMWRVVSGMFRNRLIFYDAEVSSLLLLFQLLFRLRLLMNFSLTRWDVVVL
jgi:hypothetical protein